MNGNNVPANIITQEGFSENGCQILNWLHSTKITKKVQDAAMKTDTQFLKPPNLQK